MGRRRKIKRAFRIFWILFFIFLTLGVVAYFVAANYYLPRYFEQHILPELTKEAGIRGFSGKVKTVGAFGADLGALVIGDAANPTFRAESVTIDYSLKNVYKSGRLSFNQVVFRGVNLRCAIKNDRLVINDIDRDKFISELKSNFSGGSGKTAFSVSQLIVRKSVLDLDWHGSSFQIPFELYITPETSDWSTIKTVLKMFWQEREIKVESSINLDAKTISSEIAGVMDIKRMVELAEYFKLANFPANANYSGEIDFSGALKGRFEPTLEITGFSLNGKITDGRINAGDISLKNSLTKSQIKKPVNVNISKERNAVKIDISDFMLVRPVNAELSGFSIVIAFDRKVPIDFTGRLKLPMNQFSFWNAFDLKPLQSVILDHRLSGSFKRDDSSWQFNTIPVSSKNGEAIEWLFKYKESYFMAEVKVIELGGRGSGKEGELELTLTAPGMTVTDRDFKVFAQDVRLSEQLKVSIKDRWNLMVSKAKGVLTLKGISGAGLGYKFDFNDLRFASVFNLDRKGNDFPGNISWKADDFSFRNEKFEITGSKLNSENSLNLVFATGKAGISECQTSLKASTVKYKQAERLATAINLSLDKHLKFSREYALQEFTLSGVIEQLKLEDDAMTGGVWDIGFSADMVPDEKKTEQAALKSGIKFQKLSVQNNSGIKIVASKGGAEVNAKFKNRFIAGIMPEKIFIKTGVERGWYFNAERKIRVQEPHMDIELSFGGDKPSLSWYALSNAKLAAVLKEFDFSDKKFFVKAGTISAGSEIALDPAKKAFADRMAAAEITLTVPSASAGYEDMIFDCTNAGITSNWKRGQGSRLNTVAECHDIKVKSFKYGTADAALLKFTGAAGYDGIAGRLKVDARHAKVAEQGLDIKGLSADLPVGWPALKPGESGTLKLEKAAYKWFEINNTELDVSTENNAALFKGNFYNNLFPGAVTFCFGRFNVIPDKLSLDIDLSVPAHKTDKTFACGILSPELDGLTFYGTFQGKANIKADSDGVRHQAQLKLSDSQIGAGEMTLRGIDTECNFSDIISLKSLPEQKCSFKNFQCGTISLDNGSFEFRMDSAGSLYIGKNEYSWLGGRGFIKPFNWNRKNKEYNLTGYCEKVPVPALLESLGLKNVLCSGFLSGKVPVNINDGKLSVVGAELQSLPSRPELIKIPGLYKFTGPDATGTLEFVCDSFKNGYIYSWLKMGYSSSAEGVKASITADGRNAVAPAFVYDRKSGKFTRVSAGNGNIAGGIGVDINLKIPVSAVLN